MTGHSPGAPGIVCAVPRVSHRVSGRGFLARQPLEDHTHIGRRGVEFLPAVRIGETAGAAERPPGLAGQAVQGLLAPAVLNGQQRHGVQSKPARSAESAPAEMPKVSKVRTMAREVRMGASLVASRIGQMVGLAASAHPTFCCSHQASADLAKDKPVLVQNVTSIPRQTNRLPRYFNLLPGS